VWFPVASSGWAGKVDGAEVGEKVGAGERSDPPEVEGLKAWEPDRSPLAWPATAC